MCKTYSIVHIYHLSTHIFIWSSPVWLFLLRFFSPLLDHAPCSQGDETTMLSISRPSWRYRKIKTRVPRTWQTTPLQHQCVVTPISSPTTETNSTAASVFCDSESAHPTYLTVQAARHVLFLHCHDGAGWLLGGDCVCPAAIQGGAANPCKCSPFPSQVSTLVQILKTNYQIIFVRS